MKKNKDKKFTELKREERKKKFLERYKKTLNKSKSMKGLFYPDTLYRWLNTDEEFAKAVIEIEVGNVLKAEDTLVSKLNSEDDKVALKAANDILNSRNGRKHSRFSKVEENTDTDKAANIEYVINI